MEILQASDLGVKTVIQWKMSVSLEGSEVFLSALLHTFSLVMDLGLYYCVLIPVQHNRLVSNCTALQTNADLQAVFAGDGLVY